MTIRFLLIGAACFLLFWFLTQRSSLRAQASSKMVALAMFVVAVVAILFPELTNEIAQTVGVGRGADLLLYGLTLTFFVTLLLQHIRRQDDQQKLIKLAQRIAILEASRQYKGPKYAAPKANRTKITK